MNTTLLNILLVGLGSCLGGVARYLVSKGVTAVWHTVFPWGTFLVNIAGCLIIGLVYGYLDKGGTMSEGMRLFLTVGFCGGFTTFSTFMNENYMLFTGPAPLSLALYATASVAAGFLMVYAGYWIISR